MYSQKMGIIEANYCLDVNGDVGGVDTVAQYHRPLSSVAMQPMHSQMTKHSMFRVFRAQHAL